MVLTMRNRWSEGYRDARMSQPNISVPNSKNPFHTRLMAIPSFLGNSTLSSLCPGDQMRITFGGETADDRNLPCS